MIDDKQFSTKIRDSWQVEIERAVRQVQQHGRNDLDRWFRQEWHRRKAVSKWPEWRKRLYWQWRRKKNLLWGTAGPDRIELDPCRSHEHPEDAESERRRRLAGWPDENIW